MDGKSGPEIAQGLNRDEETIRTWLNGELGRPSLAFADLVDW
jgi:hypothetical protein